MVDIIVFECNMVLKELYASIIPKDTMKNMLSQT